VGLFGLSFKRDYFNSKFWLYFLPALIIFDCIDMSTLIQQSPVEDIGFTYIALVIISPMLFVCWYAVFKYSTVIKNKLNQ